LNYFEPTHDPNALTLARLMTNGLPKLTEAEVVRMTYEHIRGLFPRNCAHCGQTFATYQEYVQKTTPIGEPVSYDIELDDWQPAETTGNFSFANCHCGNTIALNSQGMPLTQIWQVLNWVKEESEQRGVPASEILHHLREAVRQRGLAA
jgi:hypothetical protein